MDRLDVTVFSRSPEATAALAAQVGVLIAPGDTILLTGPIGAGKTHFARSLIQSLLLQPEDVPSPTYTLVQTYDTTAGELWHADLYRLGAPDEIVELGLADAFGQAICIVEWPDRLGDLVPDDALWLGFQADANDAERRSITVRTKDPKWAVLGGWRDDC